MIVNIFLLILIVGHWGFGQTLEPPSGNEPAEVTESSWPSDSLSAKSEQLSVEEVEQSESQLTELPLAVKPFSYIAIVPKDSFEPATTLDLNVDSLIRREINDYQLAKLDVDNPFESRPIDVLKTDSEFANYTDSLGIDQLLVWVLAGTSTELVCELELINISNYAVTRHATIRLGIDGAFNHQRIRAGVWQIFERIPPPEAFPSKKDPQKALLAWFTASPKRSALAAVSTAILVWYVIRGSESDSPTSGIGQPPDWPQN